MTKYESLLLWLTTSKNYLCTNLNSMRWSVTSLMLISASTYWSPFCRMEMRAAGGTRVPLMLDWLMWLSMPNVNAEWEKPAAHTHKTPMNRCFISTSESICDLRNITSKNILYIKCKGWFICPTRISVSVHLTPADICRPGSWLHHW